MNLRLTRLKEILSSKDKSLTKQAITNSSYNFATNLISKIGGLIFTIVLARILMPDLYGLYSLVLSVVLTIATFTDLGINTTLTRYLAESLAKGKKYEAEARSRTRFLFNLKLFFSFLVSLILFLLAPLISSLIFHRPEMITPLQVGSLYLFAMAIQGFFATIFYPLRKIQYTTISETINQILKIGLFLLFIQLYQQISIVFWVMTNAVSISAMFYLIVLLIKNKKLLLGKIIPIEKRNMTIFLGWTVLFTSLLPLYTYLNTFIMGLFVENAFIGYYSIIWSLVFPISTFVNFSAVFLPIFTEIQKERLSRGFKKVIKYSTMFGIPASVGLAFIIIPIIRVFYGSSYVPQQFYIPILISAILICMLIIEEIIVSNYVTLFMAKENLKIPTTLLILSLFINLILAVVFIKIALLFGPQWTLVAIALATILTRYTFMFCLVILSKKNFKVSINKLDIILQSIASIIMLGFLFMFDYIFNPGLWLTILMVVLAAAIYFLSLFLINKIKIKK